MRASDPVTGERLVPVWLSVEDLQVVERSLDQYALTCRSDPNLQHQIAALKKHFDWVRGECVITPG